MYICLGMCVVPKDSIHFPVIGVTGSLIHQKWEVEESMQLLQEQGVLLTSD